MPHASGVCDEPSSDHTRQWICVHILEPRQCVVSALTESPLFVLPLIDSPLGGYM